MKRCLVLLLALLALSGCAGSRPAGTVYPAEEAAAVFTDDLGREISLAPPRRVAAMIGSFAGIWAVSGGEDTLVSEAESREFYGDAGSRDKTLKIYPFLYHEILNEPCKEEILGEIKKWLDRHTDC